MDYGFEMSQVVHETRLELVVRERAAARRETAVARVQTILEQLGREGIDAKVIGSLATGRFAVHSDVDLLIRTPVTPDRRALVERIVAGAMRGSGLPYDVVYASDLAPERLKEFDRDIL
jgi:predicted nucleotidyltransferase